MGEVTFSRPRPLGESDSLEGFSCGLDVVDSWVQSHARTAGKAGTAVVYVSYAGDELAGLYTLSSQSMLRSDARGRLTRNTPEQIPVILLGVLGVDTRYQGKGLGRNLLLDASKRAAAVSQSIGARALVVDPATDSARRLYLLCGFRDIPGSERMYAKLR